MRPVLAIAFCAFALSPLRAADEFTAAQAKPLIAEAAGVPADVFQKLASDPAPTPDKLADPKGKTLTWWTMSYAPDKDTPKKPTSFKFIGDTMNPSAIAKAITGPDKTREYASLIHPEYITDCTVKVNGDTATGTVSFKAEKLYEGKVEYTARKNKDGAWRIEEFRLPDYKVTLALGKDGKWAKK